MVQSSDPYVAAYAQQINMGTGTPISMIGSFYEPLDVNQTLYVQLQRETTTLTKMLAGRLRIPLSWIEGHSHILWQPSWSQTM